jgi:hypothetical protein
MTATRPGQVPAVPFNQLDCLTDLHPRILSKLAADHKPPVFAERPTHRLPPEAGAASERSARRIRRIETATLGGSSVQRMVGRLLMGQSEVFWLLGFDLSACA